MYASVKLGHKNKNQHFNKQIDSSVSEKQTVKTLNYFNTYIRVQTYFLSFGL